MNTSWTEHLMNVLTQIKEEISSIERTSKKLRHFGMLFTAIFVGLSVFVFDGTTTFLGYLTALVTCLLTIFKPSWLLRPYLVWMGLSTVVGFFVSRIILVLTYCCVILPIGLVMQVFKGRAFKSGKPSKSYWHEAEPDYNIISSLERQD